MLSLEEKRQILISLLDKPEAFFNEFGQWIRETGQRCLQHYMKLFFRGDAEPHILAKKLQAPFLEPGNDKMLHFLKQIP